jgi:TPR repeat protein
VTHNDGTNALAEGFFWMGEKLLFAYEKTLPNPEEALKVYKQAADLGLPRADLRIGQMLERGVGLVADPSQALAFYRKAADAGEIVAYAAIARLLSQSTQASKADLVWRKFFSELAKADARDLGIDEPAASIHSYLFSKLARFEMPRVFPAMSRYRAELIAYMQRYLEHAFDPEQLDIMQSMQDWVKEKLPDG